MDRTSRFPFLFCVFIATAAASGCAGNRPAAHVPAWLSQNLPFVKANVEGTVLVDAAPRGGGLHHGGVGIVLDARHALVPAHVVRDAGRVSVHPRAFYEDIPGVMVGEPVEGRIVAADAAQDAALFEAADDLGTRAMTVDASRRPAAGEHVWYFGKGNAVRFGAVTAPSAVAGPMADAIQVAVDADYGDSGAPLVTDDGRVVGFLYATSVDDKRTYFIPIGRALASVGRR